MSLKEWTVGRVAAAWVLWLVLALGAAVGAAVAYGLLWAPAPGMVRARVPVVTGGAAYHASIEAVLIALLGPPALLTAAWAWQRRRDR